MELELELGPEAEAGLERARRARGAAGGWRRAARRHLPVLRWARGYGRASAAADAVAGVTLGLTLVPQSIAYAALANLPVHFGLYSAFVGTMLYVVLGTVKEVSIGPTSLMALLTLHTCRGLPVDFMVLLTFLSGVIVMLMGLLRLGFLVELISPSVTSGFTSATAMIIVVAQLKGLLGLNFVAESPVENIILIVQRWREMRSADAILATVCCTLLLLLRKLKDLRVSPKRPRLQKTLWLVSIARNALVVFAASAVAYFTYDPLHPLFKLSGKVEPGLPEFGLPPFSTVVDNRTVTFTEMTARLGSGVVLLPLMMVLANIAIAKAFSPGGRVDAMQEMVTLGVCNMAGACVRAMPTCGAFTRSAVSQASGVRSPAAGLYAGLLALLALNYLTDYFFFIPKACLSSVLICAVVFMIDFRILLRLWRSSRCEAVVAAGTWGVGVGVGVEAAVLGGALASLAMLLFDMLRTPEIYTLKCPKDSADKCVSAVVVRPRGALVYVNAARAEAVLRRAAALLAPAAPSPPAPAAPSPPAPAAPSPPAPAAPSPPAPAAPSPPAPAAPSPPVVLVDCEELTLLDYTAAQMLERVIRELAEEGRPVLFYRAGAAAARRLRRLAGLLPHALHARTARAALAQLAAATAATATAATATTAATAATAAAATTAAVTAATATTAAATAATATAAGEHAALLDRSAAHEDA